MKQQIQTLQAELIKNKYATILLTTFVAFALAPVTGGVFMMIIQNPEAMAKSGALAAKVKATNFQADWRSYVELLTQAVGVGGVFVFGFVASWIFGREYSDGTAKDLLSLPVSRTKILNAKFAVYAIWCIVLVISNLLIGFIIGVALQLPVIGAIEPVTLMRDYFVTTGLTILVGVPIAFFAIWGKGYLAPLGFVALTLVFAQIIAATGYGNYFPWSIPGLYSGAGGEYKSLLNFWSYAVLSITAIAGYFLTVLYWKYSDQT